jgi:NADH-quinone oxidoreductase subunit N
MIERVAYLWPEIVLFIATCAVMVLGLSPSLALRRLCSPVCALALILAGVLALRTPPSGGLLPHLMPYAKAMIAGVSLLLLLLLSGTVDREEEDQIATGKRVFNAGRTNRAEFYAFFLFSITGLMLCASADGLIWLFLALELTSLPTYVMVTISSRRARSQEAGVKYFFLGALGAAIFLYGFVLMYGGTGATRFTDIAHVLATDGMNSITLAGAILAIIGLCFKIAAVPMHFYTADVYQGAAAPVSAMLAFVPKAAGFLAIMLLVTTLAAAGGENGSWLPESIRVLLWLIAALTMTVGNVMALLQKSVKRLLAYSSIAHSGYMLVGIIAGPGDGTFANNGLAAVLFYLLCYGVMNVGIFGVVACLERKGKEGYTEVENFDDLRGLCARYPLLGWSMVICGLSLLGMPPLLGFWAKVPLFTSAISAGEIMLVLVLAVNSAIAAYYYLALVRVPLLTDPDADTAPMTETPFAWRQLATVLSAAGVIALAIAGDRFMQASENASRLQADSTGLADASVEQIVHMADALPQRDAH